MRPSWHEIWMGLAISLSERSTCTRAKVGCVLVSADNCRVLAVGYNGGGRGRENACESLEPGNCGCLHAEDNCLLKADYNDHSSKILYTTTSPCLTCAKRILNAGVSSVVYLNEYRKTEGKMYLISSGIPCGKVILEEQE